MSSIDERMIEDLIRKVAGRSTRGSGAATANRLRSSLSAMFAWGMRKKRATQNPVIGIGKHREESRKRILTDIELKAIWDALPPDTYGTILRLLLLTAARLNEMGELKWSEIDFDRNRIELPEARVKNGRAHLIPMSGTVREILQAQPRIEGRDHVFAARNGSPFSAWSIAKKNLDQRLAGKITDHWTTHDLRRTAATRMAEDLKFSRT